MHPRPCFSHQLRRAQALNRDALEQVFLRAPHLQLLGSGVEGEGDFLARPGPAHVADLAPQGEGARTVDLAKPAALTQVSGDPLQAQQVGFPCRLVGVARWADCGMGLQGGAVLCKLAQPSRSVRKRRWASKAARRASQITNC